MKENYKGILFCFIIAIISKFIGDMYKIVGGAVFGLIIGMILGLFYYNKELDKGLNFTSKKILQYAVILLGFGLNLNEVLKTGIESLPIIISTISISLIVAYIIHRFTDINTNVCMLIGVGSSICGGSAIAASSNVIDASEDEIAKAMSIVFLFNVIAAFTFPILGKLLAFSTTTPDAFGLFAGTAVNDTSSVTAVASVWDNMYNLGSLTLDKAVTVKLTRTLFIIPIVLGLAHLNKSKNNGKKKFPVFIIFFVLASLITSIFVYFGFPISIFKPFKELSKFLIIMAMVSIGYKTNIVNLIKTGGVAFLVGFSCWVSIIAVSLIMQSLMNIW
ncbi:YeiH family protein [Oceanivirga miroungae]|uniref:Sulfate exporter family transporter n=1 Tax=Oceanivirga miroungae TaxID=1130046 RepID=A0A6I8M6I4_9FUSO|nr:putative sulfate exporter family transporter [Oceanivirga miroungae]VWL85501.1 hypothetical protein OMES3154_00787 [Oceanivirga miroungae]